MTEKLPHVILQESLDNIANHLPNFKVRDTQRSMIAAVFNVLADSKNNYNNEEEPETITTGKNILVIEGPTGTGKSLGYLLSALVAAKLSKKRLVISSATVILQKQLADKDIPLVAKWIGWPVTYMIAKGRNRYICPQKLYQQTVQDIQLDFIGEDLGLTAIPKKLSVKEIEYLKDLAQQLTSKTWSGDRDTLSAPVPDAVWSSLTNDRHGCLKRTCTYFKSCPFFEARDSLDKTDIIVVNHDLLLADLNMGGGVILPNPADTLYCIDEAHHLSNKAIHQFSAIHTIQGTLSWLEKLYGLVNKIPGLMTEADLILKVHNSIEIIQENLQALSISLQKLFKDNNSQLYRCPNGILPIGFDHFITQLLPTISHLFSYLIAIQEILKREKTSLETKEENGLFERILIDFGFFISRVQNLMVVWQLFSLDTQPNQPPVAKWLVADLTANGQAEYSLCAAPVWAGPLLSERLWCKAAGAVLTSATLRSLGSFDKLLLETGLNNYPQATCIALPSPFNLTKQGQLIIPWMKTDPSCPDAHTQEVIELLPKLIELDKNEGTLVLFSSKKQMLEVSLALPQIWADKLLIQGSQPNEQLINIHFSRIQNSQPQASILFGLASFAEGLDLPGKTCTHLIIAKLPFSMPDDPISQTLAEWITQRGGNPFFEMTLSEVSIRLIQSMGRLIRSETDYGKITVLDTRLRSKSYGRLLKKSLPPFRSLD